MLIGQLDAATRFLLPPGATFSGWRARPDSIDLEGVLGYEGRTRKIFIYGFDIMSDYDCSRLPRKIAEAMHGLCFREKQPSESAGRRIQLQEEDPA